MLTRRLMLRAAWGQLIYAQVGASPEKLEKLRESVLRLTTGWDTTSHFPFRTTEDFLRVFHFLRC